MRKFLVPLSGAALVMGALFGSGNAYADQATAAALCYNWHATAQHGNRQTLTCTHTSDSGHLMYWELGGAQDS